MIEELHGKTALITGGGGGIGRATALALARQGARIASVDLDGTTLRPTYEVTMGVPGRSYAMSVANQLGLSDEIMEEATALLEPQYLRFEDWLNELQDGRRQLKERLQEADEARAQAETAAAVAAVHEFAAAQTTAVKTLAEAEANIKNEIDFNVIVPATLVATSQDLALKAELRSLDGKTVLAEAYTPVGLRFAFRCGTKGAKSPFPIQSKSLRLKIIPEHSAIY